MERSLDGTVVLDDEMKTRQRKEKEERTLKIVQSSRAAQNGAAVTEPENGPYSPCVKVVTPGPAK